MARLGTRRLAALREMRLHDPEVPLGVVEPAVRRAERGRPVEAADRRAHLGDGLGRVAMVAREREVLALGDPDRRAASVSPRPSSRPCSSARAPSMRLPPPRRRTRRVRTRSAVSTAASAITTAAIAM